ncbi:MAG: hypothetical protein GY943_11630, partial [Chloroflexi bacterium]|nr:hypothetical protein [Chloroflexota bacterium]
VYLFGLPFAAIDQMLVFASYARKDTWRPAIAGIISIVIYTFTAWALLGKLGLLSLMVADAVKHFVHTLIMLWFLQRHLGGLSGYRIMNTAVKSIIAAVVTGLVAFGVAELIQTAAPITGFLGRLLLVSVSGAAGLAAYVAVVRVLDIPEAVSLMRLAKNKIKR